MCALEVTAGGLRLRSPLILASGILGETGRSLARVFDEGAGAVVTKSIGPAERDGHPNPTFLEVEGGYVNAMGLPNPGMEGFGPEVMEAAGRGALVVGSVFGGSPREYAALASAMVEYGICAVELNLSCPHASGTGMELGTDPAMVAAVTAAVKCAVDIPVWVKLTPNVTDITRLAAAAARSGADAVVAVNTLKAIVIDADAGMPVLGNTVGGLSGPAIKQVGLRAVWDIHRMFQDERTVRTLPGSRAPSIIGVGGIGSGRDVAEYILAGATAVQIGSALADEGPGVMKRVAGELYRWMSALELDDIGSFVGMAHRARGFGKGDAPVSSPVSSPASAPANSPASSPASPPASSPASPANSPETGDPGGGARDGEAGGGGGR